MSTNSQYQAVTTTIRAASRHTEHPAAYAIVIVCVSIGIPLIIFGVLDYNKVNNFSTQASHCRVNEIEAVRQIRAKLSRVNPVWNVDIVKPQSNSTKVIVLRTNLKITGSNGHMFASSALDEARTLYAIDKIYPCYHHKQLLSSAGSSGISLKDPIQWEEPSRKTAFVLLFIGSALTVVGIIFIFIAFLYH
ncbi:unnamed protein product [Didymodactylos carnosus]|uniref:Uncharacterized protein n=1 Tax=Didymodactylos carnosus TaxID=1234261 RepID=A0A815HXI5_9BILA|nr:unnamed protein product [Didymodactylos carnosus]CAF1533627.1 unnamed protein product [Didymodactylos carnosus]CAF4234617.1 unnamed protein product [Didymodactylos carnosus]CAF4320949.1 unnamed protein product [Didymodactylos carnosus]